MYKEYKILALIPARGGSKGVKNKNIRLINKKPLIGYTISSSVKSKYIDQTVVSTDSIKIKNISIKYGASVPFIRPSEFASDKARTVDAVLHCLSWCSNNNLQFDVLVLLQPTSPLRSADDIDHAIECFFEHGCKSLCSINRIDINPYLIRKINMYGTLDKLLGSQSTFRRQDVEPYYKVNGAIYINLINEINEKTSFNDNVVGYVMNATNSIDIDTLNDLKESRRLLSKYKYMKIDGKIDL